MRIANNGQVGIGTSDPQAKLNVVGTILARDGIGFGTTSPNAATTLNHYEEGSWTPSLQGKTVTPNPDRCKYVRIGKMVHVTCQFTANGISNIAVGDIVGTLAGMPFGMDTNSATYLAYGGGSSTGGNRYFTMNRARGVKCVDANGGDSNTVMFTYSYITT